MAELNFDEILNKIAQNPDVLSKISKISESTKEGDNGSRLSEMIEAISPIFSESNKDRTTTRRTKTRTRAARRRNTPITTSKQGI